jgi:Tfp pilus assembly protein PilV
MSRLRTLGNDRGMAMPVALGAVLILAVVAVAVSRLAQSGESSARRMSADQRAFALAESGLERASATLHAAVDPASAAALAPGSEVQDGGTVGWSGSLAGTTWTLTGTGSIPGEGGAAPATRTASAKYSVSVAGSPWEYVFAGNPSSCTTLAGTVGTPLWVAGDLCVSDGATFTGPKLHVEGVVDTATSGQIGTSTTPVGSANLVFGCAGGAPDPHACTSADRVWASSVTQVPGTLTKPQVDLDAWYTAAKPGPANACTSGNVPGGFDNDGSRNGSHAPFDLTGGTSYSCVFAVSGTPVGRLEWLPGSPGVLTVGGVVFFDGDVTSSGDAIYTGRGTIYSSGSVSLPPGARLCGVAGCGAGWNPAGDLVTLVAGQGDLTVGAGAVLQAAGYASAAYILEAGALNSGPVIADNVSLAQDAGPQAVLTTISPGAPGIDTTLHPVGGSWNG